ncbi:ribonuclease III [Roseofilum reptotaenium CS-1145]|uniref:Ribonuclease 3 n=1 Tax=Roseofilum reptotaenium AO1-A TaxID=1925591 RepID=A0A1L9QKX1_9CYAN|nr:ribonuclease III [Roseofilum reptotaenium]MDB9515510.1 ribonuclease III [Roseofilum reptotaenium CS-1145]OJJ18154.1 ribonuclease III [Roseofilum reptotaenium AO1-A]
MPRSSQPIQLPTLKDEALWLHALTHRSYTNEHSDTLEDNEALEFLGDAVLGFLVSELIYKRYGSSVNITEAQMTRLRSKLVDEKQLARLAGELGIGDLMRLGKGAIQNNAQNNPALLSDTLEAIIGAYYLDAGIVKVRQFVTRLFTDIADDLIESSDDQTLPNLIDSKGKFQQWALKEYQQTPDYKLVKEAGEDHEKIFWVEVWVKGKKYGEGQGRRKKEAEKKAAEDALQHVGG